MFQKRSALLILLLLPLLLLTAACGAVQHAATPAADATLASYAAMHQLRLDHADIASAYFKGCTAVPRTIDVPTCNKWDAFDTAWRADYRIAGVKLDAVKATGTGQSDVDMAIGKLRADLNTYKR